VALVRTDVSEEPGASFIRVTKICELGTQEPHGVTTQKTPFFIVTAVKTSNLTYFLSSHNNQQIYLARKEFLDLTMRGVTPQSF
jgi:hypothetical protein